MREHSLPMNYFAFKSIHWQVRECFKMFKTFFKFIGDGNTVGAAFGASSIPDSILCSRQVDVFKSNGTIFILTRSLWSIRLHVQQGSCQHKGYSSFWFICVELDKMDTCFDTRRVGKRKNRNARNSRALESPSLCEMQGSRVLTN